MAINALFAGITYESWNADEEAIFNGILQTTFALVGLDVRAEVHSAKGRCDLLVETAEYIYVMELKLDGNTGEALDQIKAKGYMEPYLASPKKKLALGINFSSRTRQVEDFKKEVY